MNKYLVSQSWYVDSVEIHETLDDVNFDSLKTSFDSTVFNIK
jgi:hypothetical protein